MSKLGTMIVALAGIFTAPALAQTPTAGWVTDTQTGCQVWNADPHDANSASWSGLCPLGYAEGVGVVKWYANGKLVRRDEGEFREGKLAGPGSRLDRDGAQFQGFWRNSRAHGEGRYIAPDGKIIEGTWKNGCLSQGTRQVRIGASPAECR